MCRQGGDAGSRNDVPPPEQRGNEELSFRPKSPSRRRARRLRCSPNARGYRWRHCRRLDHGASLSADCDRDRERARHRRIRFRHAGGLSSATFGMQTAADMIAGSRRAARLRQSGDLHQPSEPARPRNAFHFRRCGDGLRLERAENARGGNCLGDRRHALNRHSEQHPQQFRSDEPLQPEAVGAPDKLITQKGRKVFKEVVPMVAEFMLEHLAELRASSPRTSSASGCIRPTST